MTRVRVRGIYSTALTRQLLDEGFDVVDASPPIRERFAADFETAPVDVDVWMTPGRQGVGVAGRPTDAEEVLAVVADAGVDTFSWRDRAARGAVFNAVVERTVGGGAVVALSNDHEGYLPFDDADQHVSEGDHIRVQVHDPNPWWARDRPVVSTELRAIGALASLDRGVDALVAGTPDGSPEHELARTTELLPVEVPDQWGVYWHYAADAASMDALGDALENAVSLANRLEDAVADAPRPSDTAPHRVAAPEQTTWVWFGRESRFELDDARRDVTPTLPGHHRIKAGSDSASSAVDFAEALGATPEAFPFGTVTDQFGPTEGDLVAIRHGKPDGRRVTLGRGEVTDRDRENGRVTVRREMTAGGTYDALGVEREHGDVATTRFTEGNWWYPTIYKGSEGQVKGTYLNVSTPVEVFPDAVRYVDLHVDVVKHADGTVEVVDEDELQDCVDAGHVSEALADEALGVAERVRGAVSDDD
jgi:Ribonuclease G/E